MASPLSYMPCFALYSASRAVSQAYRAVLSDDNLTYPQFLVVIALEAEGESSVAELARSLSLDSGTLSPLLQRLERRGILTRERRLGDERTVIVSLTPEGHDLHKRVAAKAECLGPAYGGGMDELNDLIAQLQRISEGMSALTADLRTTTDARP